MTGNGTFCLAFSAAVHCGIRAVPLFLLHLHHHSSLPLTLLLLPLPAMRSQYLAYTCEHRHAAISRNRQHRTERAFVASAAWRNDGFIYVGRNGSWKAGVAICLGSPCGGRISRSRRLAGAAAAAAPASRSSHLFLSPSSLPLWINRISRKRRRTAGWRLATVRQNRVLNGFGVLRRRLQARLTLVCAGSDGNDEQTNRRSVFFSRVADVDGGGGRFMRWRRRRRRDIAATSDLSGGRRIWRLFAMAWRYQFFRA